MTNDDIQASLYHVFQEIAGQNHQVLGEPEGEPAFAYLRVSSSGQAEEGRSGLPRQLLHIHQKAVDQGLKIPWNLVFYDDHSGFDFRSRPGLNLLLTDIAAIDRPAHHLVMEYLDRLSRQAKWHQGFLLDLFAEHRLEVHFWKPFGSEIERAVFGVISEQGMRHEIERMTQGTRLKAQSGRVTAKTPAYGYVFADSQGRPSTDPASEYRQDTHYLPHPQEAPIIQEIYALVVAGESLYQICDDLNYRQIPTPKQSQFWETSTVSKMIKSTVYKGEYIANRLYNTKEWSDKAQRMVRKQRTRPPEEWIIVDVPALVAPETWELAQEAPKRNLKLAIRNGDPNYLLQGLMKCADCGETMNIITSNRAGEQPRVHGYVCRSRMRQPSIRRQMPCEAPYARGPELDESVWNSICAIIADPEIIASYIDEIAQEFEGEQVRAQIARIERQLTACERENERWDQAYAAEVFSLEEYKDKKLAVASRREQLEEMLRQLQEEQFEIADLERQKDMVREYLRELRQLGLGPDIPFPDKRRIVGLLVDKIVLNTRDRWYQLEGAISGAPNFTPSPADLAADFTCMSTP